jgi:hypothetical protein
MYRLTFLLRDTKRPTQKMATHLNDNTAPATSDDREQPTTRLTMLKPTRSHNNPDLYLLLSTSLANESISDLQRLNR